MHNTDKKYIVHVFGYVSEKFGTLERYTLKLIKECKKNKIEVILVYNSLPKSKEFLKELDELNAILIVSDALKIIQFWKSLTSIKRKYRPILIHSHFQPLLPSLYGYLLGIKFRWNSNHLMLFDNQIEQIKNKSELKKTSRVYRYLINLFTNRFFCVSKAVKEQYISIYPNQSSKLSLLYNGVELSNYNKQKSRDKLNFSDDTIYIATIAFASKIKGVDILIDAFYELIQKHKNEKIKLCLIGLAKDNVYTNFLLDKIESYHIENKVINFGIINNIYEVLPAMDIYVQSSRSESLSMSIIEAGMFEIPAIGSNVGGIPEVIIDGKTGFLFPVSDSKSLAEKIMYLVQNPNIRREMGSVSRTHKLANFEMSSQVNKLVKIYNSVINE